MITAKATMIAITKHETDSYYVIILTFSPVILHCSSCFTLQWKLICIFFASEALWDFFLIQTESNKNYTYRHQFTQSHVINFFSSWSFVSTFMRSLVLSLEFWKCLFIQFSSTVELPETCTCQSLFHEFHEDETLL